MVIYKWNEIIISLLVQSFTFRLQIDNNYRSLLLLCINKFNGFVYMLIRSTTVRQRMPCIIHISSFGDFSSRKKSADHTGINMGIFYMCTMNQPHVQTRYFYYAVIFVA